MTLYKLAEQINSMLEGGDPPVASKFGIGEIKEVAVQVINSLIKTQHFSEELAGGETIPDGSVLTEYDNIDVEPYKGVSRATLPAMPVKLPLNMGIYHVGKTDDPFNGFIPYEPCQLQMIGEESMISDVLGQVAYEPMGKYIIFNSDITANDEGFAITRVNMRLVIKDLSLWTDYELLPIPASMEAEVIEKVFTFLSAQLPSNKKVDVITKQEGGNQ